MFTAALRAAALSLLLGCASAGVGAQIPPDIVRQLPPGYSVLSSASSSVTPEHRFVIVALASRTEAKALGSRGHAPARPLFIFERRAGRYALVGRNDSVMFRADDGGINGCDPFEARAIAVKGPYFTVEQGVACGVHWADYVTFRFDRRAGAYVFDNWRVQSWSLNPSTDPKAPALISPGPRIVRAKGRALPFARWKRPGAS